MSTLQKVQAYYKQGLWTGKMLSHAVEKGWITAEDYQKLTGCLYEPQKPDKISVVQETQLTIMESMAEQYEEGLERDLQNKEVQATIYEAIMALQEGGN